MAVTGLLILSGVIPGIRDLMWSADKSAVLGYMAYRAENRYGPWTALSPDPIPGERFRDETTLTPVIYTVTDADWTDRGTYGYWAFRVPNAPIYGEVVNGRVILASTPAHVSLVVDGKQIQAARVDGVEGRIWVPQTLMVQGHTPAALPYVNLTDTSVVTVTYNTLTNFVEPTPERRSFYTIVPIGADGLPLHEPGVVGDVVNIMEVDKMDFMQAAMVERNAWEFEFSGEPAYLLIKRTKGTECACKAGSNQARTGCPSCYETGIVGGYYGPYDIPFIDPDAGTTTETTEGGRKVTRASRSYLSPTPPIAAGDLIVRKNGERLVISNPTYKSPRGVLLQQDFDVNLIQYGDTRYMIPLRTTATPIVYNPGFQDSPGVLGEPVTTPLTDPTKNWENDKQVPTGRTIVFGNIQT